MDAHPSPDPAVLEPLDDAADGDVRLSVEGGRVRIHCAEDARGSAELSWPEGCVRVKLFGEPVEGFSCRVPAHAALEVEPVTSYARIEYGVEVARDRMQATLKVIPQAGTTRTLQDQPPRASLRLVLEELRIEPQKPADSAAAAALQGAGIAYGIDAAAVAEALASPGREFVIATGTEPIQGRSGYLQHLVDFEEVKLRGVLAGTPLVRRARSREGIPGRDVTGRELAVAAVKEARLRAGDGVSLNDQSVLAESTVDGSPRELGEEVIEVRHELTVEEVDQITGDIEFNGTVRVSGSVHEGRRIVARDEIIVQGNVDRGHLESGGTLTVRGSIMSSVLRAGGERAVAASIADRVLELPRMLGVVAAQARQIRDQGEQRGTEVSHGLSVQLVLERIHRQVLPNLLSVVEDLREAGPGHAHEADRARTWHRLLATAANSAITPEQFQEILVKVGALAEDVRRAIDEPADLIVTYMQACEAEATGTLTIAGKGVFNSRIVAWGGLHSEHPSAVLRGGSVISHGPVRVHEVGSPAGATTLVQLGRDGALETDLVRAGTVVSGPGYTHRFVADRTCVRVDFDSGGSMNVELLAA